jgi:protein O-GlcNAc transferase
MKKIKVAYVSSDFMAHPVSYLTAGLFELHDREYFEIHAVSLKTASNIDNYRLRIEKSADKFIDISKSDDSTALNLLRDENYDIAIDLNGHTANARTKLFIHRFAKKQINYIGYVGTMGHSSYDFIIADDYVIPEEYSKFYIEKIICLPFFQSNDYKRKTGLCDISRDTLKIPSSAFVLCALNANYKFNEKICQTWSNILHQIENSYLVIYFSNNIVKTNLENFFNKNKILHKIRWITGTDYETYLARYELFDLFLDTDLYNGGTTVSDALWSGIPVVTLEGRSYSSRMAASMLNKLEMHECIAKTHEDYFSIVVDIFHSEKYKNLKVKAKNFKNNIIFDSKEFIQNIELAYFKVYKDIFTRKYNLLND